MAIDFSTLDWESPDLYRKTTAPWEDSPGKGSRDQYVMPAAGWGASNIGKYLSDHDYSDPYGIFDPESITRWKEKARIPGTPGVQGEGGWEATPDTFDPSTRFTEFTLPQLQSYLDRQRNDYLASGNQGNDAMWLPSYREIGGQPFVSTGEKTPSKAGFGDFLEQGLYAAAAAAAGGAGSWAGGLGAGSMMPAAIPELAAANAFPGGVTALSGMGNAVTAGLAGTSGAAGLGAGIDWSNLDSLIENVGSNSFELENLSNASNFMGGSSPFNLSNAFDFASDILGPNGFTTGYGGLGGGYVGDFTASMLPGGSMSPFGATGGGMIDLSGGGMGSVLGTGNQGSFLENLMSRFGNQKDLLKLGGSLAQQLVNKKNNKRMMDAISQSRNAGFPFQNYQHLAQMWSDPAQRYQMLQSNPAYKAAEDYVKQAAMRRNARTGDLNSGFGAATMASVLGQNAAAWDKQQFDQIRDITGMGFNGNQVTSQLAASLYPQIAKNNMNTAGSIFDAIRSNQGFFPDMLKTFFA